MNNPAANHPRATTHRESAPLNTREPTTLNPELDVKFNGVIQYIDSTRMIASRGFQLFESLDSGTSWTSLGTAPVAMHHRCRSWIPLLRRFCRAQIGNVVLLDESNLLFFAADKVWRYDLETRRFLHSAPLVGRRPLTICRTGDSELYYGEYRRNFERTPTHLWRTGDSGKSWEAVHRFTNIRHVHGVFHDPFTDSLWVTTGDDDEECGLWQSTDGGVTMTRIIGGSQQFRAVHLLFREDAIYFGSDTPREKNHLYRLHRKDHSVERLCEVDNSVFFATDVGGTMCFSTACEQSDINRSPYASVWASTNGDDWSPIVRMTKDGWPSPWLQHGHIRFPTGIQRPDRLCFTTMATNLHETVLCVGMNAEQAYETETNSKAA